jgi:hypothetical protein
LRTIRLKRGKTLPGERHTHGCHGQGGSSGAGRVRRASHFATPSVRLDAPKDSVSIYNVSRI